MIFFYGFLAGVFANQVFGMLTRLLPPTWVRYQVKVGKFYKSEELDLWTWILAIRIEPPRWKRALVEPYIDYLEGTLTLNRDTEKAVDGKCVKGDVTDPLLRADGAMTVFMLVFSGVGSTGCLGDNTMLRLQGGKHTVSIGVLRSVDQNITAEMEFPIIVEGGKPVLDASLIGKYPGLIKWKDMPSKHIALATVGRPG